MSAERDKSIVQRLFDEVMKGNLAIADELIAEDYAQHSVFGIPNGREALKQFFMGFASAVPDAQFVVEDVIAEGDKVVSRLTVTGTQSIISLMHPKEQRPPFSPATPAPSRG